MRLYRKVQAVKRVFENLEREVATFQNATGMKCVSGCGLCCKKPDISATPLEFLPLAYKLYSEGDAFIWLERLQINKDDPLCSIFAPLRSESGGGLCSQYKYRGLICRLFGFSAMVDKTGNPQLVTCNTIKTVLPGEYKNATEHVINHHPVPIMRDFYFQLRAVDSELGQTLMPINKAIIEALKTVLSYYAYRQKKGA